MILVIKLVLSKTEFGKCHASQRVNEGFDLPTNMGWTAAVIALYPIEWDRPAKQLRLCLHKTTHRTFFCYLRNTKPNNLVRCKIAQLKHVTKNSKLFTDFLSYLRFILEILRKWNRVPRASTVSHGGQTSLPKCRIGQETHLQDWNLIFPMSKRKTQSLCSVAL